ncbi:MAG: IS66 family transposase [Noviherbaspirillum sp.]
MHDLPSNCDACGSALDMSQAVVQADGRQVIDLPPVRVQVTEHRVQSVHCTCGKLHASDFPKGVTKAVQYGPLIKAALVYLTQYQHLPMKRCTQAMHDLFGVDLSAGSVHAVIAEAHKTVKPIVAEITDTILQAPVVHFDETGMRVDKKLHWMHSASTDNAVVYNIHAKRGWEGMQKIGILSQFKGVAVHDGWPSYANFEGLHALCNAHHLRDLIFVFESTEQQWARSMMTLLCEIKAAVDASATGMLSPANAAPYWARYRSLVAQGQSENPPILTDPTREHKKGGIKQSLAHNLLKRLDRDAEDVLRFMTHPLVPFDNNTAERDIRMPKLKHKISGCFRSLEGAQAYCCIRSYLATLRKQSRDIMAALTTVFAGNMPAAG